MNGNITKESVRKDILWMHDAGIAGFHCFDAGNTNVQIVEDRKFYMSDGWKEIFNYAMDLADSLGMEVAIASSPGWSITGGPWVSEEDAQKKLVWREMTIEGGQHYTDTLPAPFVHCGPYQEARQYKDDRYEFYRDMSVVAVKCPAQDTARILYSKVKAGFEMDYKVSDHYPTPPTEDCTSVDDVIDITAFYKDGILDWDVPEGKWKVFRFGYNLLGRVNGPASPEATGLEVDKLNPDAVRRYYDNYFAMYQDATGNRLGKSIKYLMIDSYESGKATWTDDMEEQFLKRRGYSLRPWLPVLTGQIIGSSQQSERFLFDWRQTLGELFTESHYDSVNDILKEYGMKRYTESHEERTAFTGDGMMVKRNADIPMSAFWVRYRAGWHSSYPGSDADLRESSSVAHIYGQNVCSAESFTTNGKIGKWDGFGAYQCYPGNLKPVADAAMAQGLNRFIIHSCVHQPCDGVFPGLGLGPYGQWFNRHDTWAGEAKAWTDYLSRCCYMLQQGRFVADIAYFYGEDKNITGRFYDERVQIPDGWNYDFVNADVLLNVFRIKKKGLETPSGMRYRILVVDKEVKYMSFPVLKRIAKMARKGVLICGPRPQGCANLNADDKAFAKLVAKVWDRGRKNVFEDGDIANALLSGGIAKDVAQFDIQGSECPCDSVDFVHRTLRNGEIYWVSNNSATSRDIDFSLRTSNLKPQVWDPEYAATREVSYWIENGRTRVRLHMNPDQSLFIVLLDKAEEESQHVPDLKEEPVSELSGPWNVRFQEGRGAPEEATFDELVSFTESKVPGIRYFSGTATYSSNFNFKKEEADGYELDLGAVGNIARVVLNGKDLGLLWHAPYRADVSDAILDGENTIEVKVINSWANRLIGDEQPGVGKRITFTATQFYEAGSPLVPSGLMGPVKVLKISK